MRNSISAHLDDFARTYWANETKIRFLLFNFNDNEKSGKVILGIIQLNKSSDGISAIDTYRSSFPTEFGDVP